MKKTLPFLCSVLILSVTCGTLSHGGSSSTSRFKSPSGKYEVFFEPVNDRTVRQYRSRSGDSPNQKPQFIIFFYVAGSSDSVSSDWYTDIEPTKAPSGIFPTMVWSPQEDYVLVTHGLNAKEPDLQHWIVSLTKPTEFGFMGDHVRWVDRNRLVSDINNEKVPGGIQLIDAQKGHGDLVLPPVPGRGYLITAHGDHAITVKEFINSWSEGQDKTSWESFTPACFELNLDRLRKRSVPCKS